jgi:hypothetical protein
LDLDNTSYEVAAFKLLCACGSMVLAHSMFFDFALAAREIEKQSE